MEGIPLIGDWNPIAQLFLLAFALSVLFGIVARKTAFRPLDVGAGSILADMVILHFSQRWCSGPVEVLRYLAGGFLVVIRVTECYHEVPGRIEKP